MTDTDDELITIGAMARASGLTAGALRFYDDSGLLRPAHVDTVTGYRWYAPSQCEHAVLVRRLREIGIPLEAVAAIVSGDPDEAAKLLDAHVEELGRRAREAALVAESVKQRLTVSATTVLAADLARAIAQVVPAAARDESIPVLAGVLLEVDATSVTLTATDRYRLATRTVAPQRPGAERWQAVLRAPELAALPERWPAHTTLTLSRGDGAVVLDDGVAAARCTPITEPYPDHRGMLAGLAPVRTRTIVARDTLLSVLEANGDEPVLVRAEPDGLTVRTTTPGESRDTGTPIRSTTTGFGPPIALGFDPRVLRPALEAALGPDLMLDISAADQPVVVRSATDGDLTVLVMPLALPTEPS